MTTPMMTQSGLDVSEFQGYPGHNPPDWAQVKAAGIAFVIARVAYGTRQDLAIATNWAALKQTAFTRGSYQFARMGDYAADPIADAQTHVAAFLNIINQYGGIQAGDLMPAMDIETNPHGYTVTQMVDWVTAWTHDMQAALGPTTQPPILYTYLNFLTQYPFWHHLPMPVDLWIADYSTQAPANLPWMIWQHSDQGHVPGITGAVDLNQRLVRAPAPKPTVHQAPNLSVTVAVDGYHPQTVTLTPL